MFCARAGRLHCSANQTPFSTIPQSRSGRCYKCTTVVMVDFPIWSPERVNSGGRIMSARSLLLTDRRPLRITMSWWRATTTCLPSRSRRSSRRSTLSTWSPGRISSAPTPSLRKCRLCFSLLLRAYLSFFLCFSVSRCNSCRFTRYFTYLVHAINRSRGIE